MSIIAASGSLSMILVPLGFFFIAGGAHAVQSSWGWLSLEIGVVAAAVCAITALARVARGKLRQPTVAAGQLDSLLFVNSVPTMTPRE